MRREEYIFNGILDALLYWFIYIFIPVVQIILGFTENSINVYVCASISMVGLLYDCHTRTNEGMERIARLKIFVIGVVAGILLTLSLLGVIVMASENQIPRIVNFVYILIVIPLAIFIHDGWYVAKINLDLA